MEDRGADRALLLERVERFNLLLQERSQLGGEEERTTFT
jgi:hypothetical protein